MLQMGKLILYQMCLRKEARGWTDTRNDEHLVFQTWKYKMNDASHYLDYEPQNIIPEFKSIVQTST